MVSLDICSGSCNSGNDLSIKNCVLKKKKKKKKTNDKIFNIITNENEAETVAKLIQIKNGIKKTCQCEYKNYCTCK